MMREPREMPRRLRLITMAWGDAYIRQLFDYALPAVLAPGNLPALCERYDCEMVIVTSEAWFDTLRRQPIYRRISGYCPIELRPLDEFIHRPDAYGMALTYALFRGFEELGDAMLDTYLVFFNADFIMADGSLRSVARKIDEGERLVLSPSYCVVLEEVVPQLAGRRTPGTGILAIPPREMAALALRHRHNTIRGKTVNQRLFSMEWIDQFYWLVDERTLIGHQLPIAVVCMRPTRALSEMRTFWDYGIISEACPGVGPCVLADSDDFLMIELRKRETAREQISLGWPTPRQVAEKLEKFITSDPVSLARHTLVLHSDNLPADVERAKAELDAYVESVLRELPAQLTDHVNHPIWAYHYDRFHQARREYLIAHGLLAKPPAEAEPAETEAVATLPAQIDPAAAEVSIASIPPQRSRGASFALAAYKHLFGCAPNLRPSHPRWSDVQPVLRAVAAAAPDARILVVSSEKLQERLLRNLSAEHVAVRDIIGTLPSEQADERLQDDPAAVAALAELACTEPERPQSEDLPAPQAFLWTEGVQGQTADLPALASAPSDEPTITEEFDLCLCELNADDLMELRALVRNLAPRVRRGGSILVLHLNHSLSSLSNEQALILNNALALDLPCRFHFAGSKSAVKALLGFTAAVHNLRSRRPAAMARAAIQLGKSVSRARRASRIGPIVGGRPPDPMTSIAIEISVIRHAEAAYGRPIGEGLIAAQ